VPIEAAELFILFLQLDDVACHISFSFSMMTTSEKVKVAAYVTLLTNASYLPAALVLEQSLRSVGSSYPLVVMATPALSSNARDVLETRGVEIRDVDPLQPPPTVHTLSEADARFADTWTKLR
jgi:hypothetical protein